MKIKVTQKHIDAGNRGSSSSCPVALAIKETCPELTYVSVSLAAVDYQIPLLCYDLRCYKSLPLVARDFIKSFDAGNVVDSFEFDFDAEIK